MESEDLHSTLFTAHDKEEERARKREEKARRAAEKQRAKAEKRRLREEAKAASRATGGGGGGGAAAVADEHAEATSSSSDESISDDSDSSIYAPAATGRVDSPSSTGPAVVETVERVTLVRPAGTDGQPGAGADKLIPAPAAATASAPEPKPAGAAGADASRHAARGSSGSQRVSEEGDEEHDPASSASKQPESRGVKNWLMGKLALRGHHHNSKAGAKADEQPHAKHGHLHDDDDYQPAATTSTVTAAGPSTGAVAAGGATAPSPSPPASIRDVALAGRPADSAGRNSGLSPPISPVSDDDTAATTKLAPREHSTAAPVPQPGLRAAAAVPFTSAAAQRQRSSASPVRDSRFLEDL
jgi:hypothetical protein